MIGFLPDHPTSAPSHQMVWRGRFGRFAFAPPANAGRLTTNADRARTAVAVVAESGGFRGWRH
jgi:hypothetical protein